VGDCGVACWRLGERWLSVGLQLDWKQNSKPYVLPNQHPKMKPNQQTKNTKSKQVNQKQTTKNARENTPKKT